jgi:hypothetical protein
MLAVVLLLGGLILTGLVTGCGPEESNEDRILNEIRERLIQETEEVRPLVGFYVGTWTNPLGQKYETAMNLRIRTKYRRVPPSDHIFEVPSLDGAIYWYKDNRPDIVDQHMGQINAGRYNRRSGNFTLLVDLSSSILEVLPVADLIGTFVDGKMSGTLYNRGRAIGIELTRVRE